MPVVRFFGLEDELLSFCEWLGQQADVAVLSAREPGIYVAERRRLWTLPVRRALLWNIEGDPPEALGDDDFYLVNDPWVPFPAREIFPDKSIFELRLSVDGKGGAMASSWLSWRGGGSPLNQELWNRFRRRIVNGAEKLKRTDGITCFAFTGAAAAIAAGRVYSVSD